MRKYGFYGWKNADIKDKNGLTPRDYYDLLSDIWSADTCAPRMRDKWSDENKTLGQCSITAFLMQEGYDLGERYEDCGKLIFSKEQDVHAGGSGCGCSGAVLTAHFLPQLERGELGRLLFVATGALMSPLTVQQKQSIPGVAHLIFFEREENK